MSESTNNGSGSDQAIKSKDFDIEAAIESLIFVSNEPLTVEKISEIFLLQGIELSIRDIRSALQDMCMKWHNPSREMGRGLALLKVANGYQFASAPEQACLVKRVASVKPIELSKSQAEVLSIIAYRQPITRVDIDEIRGVDSSFAIKKLMHYKLVKILGKSEGLGRPLLYGTSKHFLEFFSLNSLNDLPTLKQFELLDTGEDGNEIDLENDQVIIKDLFRGNPSDVLSEELRIKSEEALLGLDEAMLRIDSVQKKIRD